MFVSELPKFFLRSERSLDNVPSIDIIFPDGHRDSMILKRHYTSEEERKSRNLGCNFLGHLEKDSKACVAVTGCPGEDNLEMTINSKHSGLSNMYILHKNGQLEMVESTFRDPRVQSESKK